MKNLTNFFGGINKNIDFLIIKDKSSLDEINSFVWYDCDDEPNKEFIKKINDIGKYIFSEEEIIRKEEIIANCIGNRYYYIIRKPISVISGELFAKVTKVEKDTNSHIRDIIMKIQLTEEDENKYVYDDRNNREYLSLNKSFYDEYYLKSKSDGKISLRKNMYNLLKLSRASCENDLYKSIYEYIDDFSGKSYKSGFYKFIRELTEDPEIDYRCLAVLNIYYLSTIPIFIFGINERGQERGYSLLNGHSYVRGNSYKHMDGILKKGSLFSRYKNKLNKVEISIEIKEDIYLQRREDFYINKKIEIESISHLVRFFREVLEDNHLYSSHAITFIENLKYPLKVTYEPGTESDILYIEQKEKDGLISNYIFNLKDISECYPTNYLE